MNLVDFRKLGIAPTGVDDDWLADVERHGLPRPVWSQSSEGALVRVTARLAGHGAFDWWIDPARDHGVVRTRVELQGRIIGEREFSLKQVDGVWFPSRVEFYRYGDGGTRADGPSRVIEFLGVEWNRPEHPREFRPDDIGVEPGARISAQDPGASSGTWNGAQVVDPMEFLLDVRAGRAHWGPTVASELMARGAVLQMATVQGESGDARPAPTRSKTSNDAAPGDPPRSDARDAGVPGPVSPADDARSTGNAPSDGSGRDASKNRTSTSRRDAPLSFNSSSNHVWHALRERAPHLYRRAWMRSQLWRDR
ncbi:MAG: hypothetical protein IPM64_01620 [Phycisphaerales bacterium]|nr:hypothetical protein [Phycisphaerales bacterium]